MQTKNVYYSEQPERIIVNSKGSKAIIELPVNTTEVKTEEESVWLAETVYSFETMNTPNLKERIEEGYEAWLAIAKQPVPQPTNLNDVVDALNALTDIIIGG